MAQQYSSEYCGSAQQYSAVYCGSAQQYSAVYCGRAQQYGAVYGMARKSSEMVSHVIAFWKEIFEKLCTNQEDL